MSKPAEIPTVEGGAPPIPEPVPPLQPDADGKFPSQQIGVNSTTLTAYCSSLTWKVRKDGHTKIIVDQIRQITDQYERALQVLEASPTSLTSTKEQAYEKSTKAILELALVGFDYEEAANNIDAGPGALGILANEVRSFLVELGGRVGQKHLQTLSKLATQSIYPGSKA